MTLKQAIKIECIKKNKSMTSLSRLLGMNSSQLLYHHISRKNNEVLEKIEEALGVDKGTFSK